jgi:hypothetical protein
MYIQRPALIIAFIPINVNRQTFLVIKVGEYSGEQKADGGAFSRVTLYKTERKLKTTERISPALIAVDSFFFFDRQGIASAGEAWRTNQSTSPHGERQSVAMGYKNASPFSVHSVHSVQPYSSYSTISHANSIRP